MRVCVQHGVYVLVLVALAERGKRVGACICVLVCVARASSVPESVCVSVYVFALCSGTMGNLISVAVHCGRGEEVILGTESHIYNYELGGLSSRCPTQLH